MKDNLRLLNEKIMVAERSLRALKGDVEHVRVGKEEERRQHEHLLDSLKDQLKKQQDHYQQNEV